MTAVTAVDALPPVSLDELVSGADLQARVDRKYLLPESSLPELLVGLPHTTRALQMEGRRSFAYRSVYLDTPDLRSYHSAGRGRRRRFKVRGRGYLDVGVTWLEVKTRAARGVTVKVRVPHDDVERKPLSGPGATSSATPCVVCAASGRRVVPRPGAGHHLPQDHSLPAGGPRSAGVSRHPRHPAGLPRARFRPVRVQRRRPGGRRDQRRRRPVGPRPPALADGTSPRRDQQVRNRPLRSPRRPA